MRSKRKRQQADGEVEEDRNTEKGGSSSEGGRSAGAGKSAWALERRRTTLSKKSFEKILDILEVNDEPLGLMRLLNVHWDHLVGTNPVATGKPRDARAARVWLLKRATECKVVRLPPFDTSCEDFWRLRFDLPTSAQLLELRSNLKWSGKRHRPGDDTSWVKNVSMNKIDNWK